MDMLIGALSQGKLCIIDVSQMRGGQAMILGGIILRRIFDRNQEEFTAADPKTIPVIAVIEEAQAILRESTTAAEPYISWVKEGRKYDLGAMLITQQPGSISNEILSQGDNWFVFHLLSAGDLTTLKKANAHFSEDLLSAVLNEPIPGQGVFWSSVGGKEYPISVRGISFEDIYKPLDIQYNKASAQTYAQEIKDRFKQEMAKTLGTTVEEKRENKKTEKEEIEESVGDVLAAYEEKCKSALQADPAKMKKLDSNEGLAWGSLKAFFKDILPDTIEDKDHFAYNLVPKVLDGIFGTQGENWHTYKHPSRSTTYIRKGKSQ